MCEKEPSALIVKRKVRPVFPRTAGVIFRNVFYQSTCNLRQNQKQNVISKLDAGVEESALCIPSPALPLQVYIVHENSIHITQHLGLSF